MPSSTQIGLLTDRANYESSFEFEKERAQEKERTHERAVKLFFRDSKSNSNASAAGTEDACTRLDGSEAAGTQGAREIDQAM